MCIMCTILYSTHIIYHLLPIKSISFRKFTKQIPLFEYIMENGYNKYISIK